MITKSQFEKGFMEGKYRVNGLGFSPSDDNIFEINPVDFLNFAEQDLKDGKDERNLVNSLSNVKRALDCQIELLIYDCGYSKRAKKERWNFPEKLKFLKTQNIVAPRILKKINTLRNLLEHEFKKPGLDKVEDALDVVTLFIHYVQRLGNVATGVTIMSENKLFCHLELDKKESRFISQNMSEDSKKIEKFTIEEGEKIFDRLMKETASERMLIEDYEKEIVEAARERMLVEDRKKEIVKT